MNIDKYKTSAAQSALKVAEYLASEQGKKTIESVSVSISTLVGTLAGARGLRKISRRFGVELTRKESYGLVVAAGAIASAVDPARGERIRRAIDRSKTTSAASAKQPGDISAEELKRMFGSTYRP
jgi:hypothetical protein